MLRTRSREDKNKYSASANAHTKVHTSTTSNTLKQFYSGSTLSSIKETTSKVNHPNATPKHKPSGSNHFGFLSDESNRQRDDHPLKTTTNMQLSNANQGHNSGSSHSIMQSSKLGSNSIVSIAQSSANTLGSARSKPHLSPQ